MKVLCHNRHVRDDRYEDHEDRYCRHERACTIHCILPERKYVPRFRATLQNSMRTF